MNHTFQRDQFEQMPARELVGIQKGGLNPKVSFSICAESQIKVVSTPAREARIVSQHLSRQTPQCSAKVAGLVWIQGNSDAITHPYD